MNKSNLMRSCAFVAMPILGSVMLPSAAYAQSTGSVDFEKEIVVTGTRSKDVGGIIAPDAPKAKAVVTQEMISRSGPGQNVLDTLNIVPGVSFQNNDAYGNAGGTLTIRGFDSTRISYTLDGIQLNDSGNYSIYSNFSIDPELIEQVNVNLGSTDVDSPTASAVGGTINQRTRLPGKDMGGVVRVSVGENDYRRLFGMFDTGEFTSFGTRAFVSASKSTYENPFNDFGKMDRQQYNARIYQPIGNNGDFVSLAGRYNQDRNNFFGSVQLRNDLPVTDGFPQTRDERYYSIDDCRVTQGVTGVADSANRCGTDFDRRVNPSNSMNIRGNSRFSLTDRLVLTVDPSYQYTKANGGGTATAREYGYDINPTGGRANCSTTAESATVDCIGGYYGGSPYFNGVDLNGDGDKLDTVTVLAPSQTRTKRYAVIAGLRYEIDPNNMVRVSYTYDRANHRQTGQVGEVDVNGYPLDVFPVNDPLTDASGVALQKRDRQSYSILNQIAAEYRGDFGPLTVNVGARMPFFKRDLENYCFTSQPNGYVECSGGVSSIDDVIEANNSGFSPPDHRVLNYKKLLPNVGVVYDFTPRISAFASYSKNISVPSTDNLYNAFYFPANTPQAKPEPETTDTFDGGVRYRSSRIQAQLAGWFTKFDNRLASAYDPELDKTIYRNLGRVNKYGIDGSIAYQVNKMVTLYAFGSWNKSEIKDNVQIGGGPDFDCDSAEMDATGLRNCAFTAGKRESGAPKYNYGASALFDFGPVELGATAKRTGPRYVWDSNVATYAGDVDLFGTSTAPTVIYGKTAPAYWLVNLDAKVKLAGLSPDLEKTFIQFNVYNLFDKLYVGGFTGGLAQGLNTKGEYARPNFVQIGAPRTFSATLNIGF